MPRKSVSDVLTERYGGKWKFQKQRDRTWVCEDGRVVKKDLNCICWMFSPKPERCPCPPIFRMTDGDETFAIDLNDPRIYKLNGASTK